MNMSTWEESLYGDMKVELSRSFCDGLPYAFAVKCAVGLATTLQNDIILGQNDNLTGSSTISEIPSHRFSELRERR